MIQNSSSGIARTELVSDDSAAHELLDDATGVHSAGSFGIWFQPTEAAILPAHTYIQSSHNVGVDTHRNAAEHSPRPNGFLKAASRLTPGAGPIPFPGHYVLAGGHSLLQAVPTPEYPPR